MKKQIINFEIPYHIDWLYGVSIKQIRDDLDELEKLGATSIDIETYYEYGDTEISIKVISNREETDKEQQERLNKLKNIKKRQEKWELEQLKKLQEKYKNNEQQ